jgi:hypothetical protein
MTLCGAHITDATVPAVMVLPSNEVADPTACIVDVDEPLVRELGSVLSRAEKRFDERVRVGYQLHPVLTVKRRSPLR